METNQRSAVTLADFLSVGKQGGEETLPLAEQDLRGTKENNYPGTTIPCQLPLGPKSCLTKTKLQFANPSILR